jgi:hypothetical protein
MNARRGFLSSTAALALVSASASARAQKSPVPDPAELRVLLVDARPQNLEPVARGTAALRTLLAQVTEGMEIPEWFRGTERLGPVIARLNNIEAQATVRKALEDSRTVASVKESSERARAPVERMELALERGGLSRGSPLSVFLFRSFFHVDQFNIALGAEKPAWYCDVYPFSAFCK